MKNSRNHDANIRQTFTMSGKGPHHLLLVWLILTGLIIFSLFIAWHEHILMLLYSGDKSRISWAITLLYILITFHCGRRVWFISNQINASMSARNIILSEQKPDIKLIEGNIYINDKTVLPECILTDCIHDHIYKSNHTAKNGNFESLTGNTDLMEVYESRLKNPHEIGWFLTDLMIKLGLLGTIVGFVLMLGSVANVTDFDVNSMQHILKSMSAGMGTALYTTFAGLVCSILAGIQYHMLDQGADELVQTATHITQIYVLPKLKQQV
ncbi:MAG: MotA/TolQ/ExbB proton channel family protein [Gammaproteobacteria bacterium]